MVLIRCSPLSLAKSLADEEAAPTHVAVEILHVQGKEVRFRSRIIRSVTRYHTATMMHVRLAHITISWYQRLRPERARSTTQSVQMEVSPLANKCPPSKTADTKFSTQG